jgi:hypothetical protein
MKKFYVRPQCDTGYGSGDGSSYENAWNGLAAVDWKRVSVDEPAQLWVCGDPQGQPGFMTVFVERSYIEAASAADAAATSPDPRRESPQPV